MRVIVFSHNYPPMRNPRSFRIRNLEQSGFFGKDYLIFSNFKLVSSQLVNLTNESDQKKWKFKKSNFLTYLKNGIRNNSFSNYLSKCIIPDRFIFLQIYYLLFYLFRYRKKDDLIYTVSNPFSSHLIGIILKKYFKHTWHADIGDVYYSMTTANWNIHRALERRVVYYSDQLILNSESIKNHFINKYSIGMEKMLIIPNGVSIKFDRKIRAAASVLRFSYIGNTYHPVRPGMKEVEFILNFIQTKSKHPIILQLFGNQNQELVNIAFQNPLSMRIDYCNTDQELEAAYANTDLLINFANINHPGLPSKLEEYVKSGIPIINFIHTEGDSSIEYLNLKKAKCLQINCSNGGSQDYADLDRFISTFINSVF